MKLPSPRTVALGTCSTADSPLSIHRSPIARVTACGVGFAQPGGNSSSSMCAISRSGMNTGIFR